MKRYKLIKWYPGIPTNTATAVQIEKNWYKITDERESAVFGSVTANTIENSSEFWEEVIPEPPFSFATADNIHIFDPDQTVYGYNTESTNVGNSRAESRWKEPTAWMYFSTSEARQAYINSLKPKPLFRTVDGRDIFPNDIFGVVTKDWRVYELTIKPGETTVLGGELVYLSSAKAAREYVLQNKPLICLRDIMDAGNTSYYINLSDSNKGKLRALAQSRLKI